MKIYEQHEIGKSFPPMREEEYKPFVENFKSLGQKVSAVIFQGKMLDGMSRQRAAIECKVKLKVEYFLGNYEEAIKEVEALNLHRRNLTDDQRACAAAKLSKLYPKTNNHNAIKRGLIGRVQPMLAKRMNVSQRKVRDATFLLNHHPEVFKKCEEGLIGVGKASRSIYLQEKPKNAPPSQFADDAEVSLYVKNLCSKEGGEWQMTLECIGGSFFCQFWGNGIDRKIPGEQIPPSISIKQATVCAIRDCLEKYKTVTT